MDHSTRLAAGQTMAAWEEKIPAIAQIRRGEEALWLRGKKPPFYGRFSHGWILPKNLT